MVSLVAAVALSAVIASGAGAASPPPSGSSAPASALPSGDALSQELDQAMADQARLDATRAALSGEIAVAHDEQTHLAQMVLDNRHQIDLTVAAIAVEERAVADADRRSAEARADAARDRAEIASQTATLRGGLRSVYEQDDNFVAYLLSSDSFGDFIARVEQARQLTDSVTQSLARLRALADDAARNEVLAQVAEEQARDSAAALAQQKSDLEAEIAHSQDLISRLTADAAAALNELNAAASQTAAIAQQVADLRIQQLDRTIADAEKAAWDEAEYYVQHHLAGAQAPATTGNGYSVSDGATPDSPRHVGPGPDGQHMQWPCYGTTFTQYFGPSTYAFEPPGFGSPHFHTGVDFAGPQGTPVRATADGVVVAATKGDTGYGNHVVVAFDDHLLALYGHLESFNVNPGDRVQAGQLLGLIGSTGNSTGPHLHFELRYDDSPVDPMPILPPLADGATGPPANPS